MLFPAELSMNLYDQHILPNLVHFACSRRPAMLQREKIVPLARGRVLEVGVGSGLNLPYYDAGKVSKLWGLDPSPEMLRRAEARARSVGFEVAFIALPGEDIPLEDSSVDTVLVTYTLCTIADVDRTLKEMARVLKPGGEMIFCEHGAAPTASVRRWQNVINPAWKLLGGGCHLNREIPKLIEQGGFRIETLEASYIPGWRPASYNYWGTAVAV
jgi:ubiquinone/menaquinone biosynthesis C-methylase UbiE